MQFIDRLSRHKMFLVTVLAFGVIGTIVLRFGLASAPDTRNEVISLPTKESGFRLVDSADDSAAASESSSFAMTAVAPYSTYQRSERPAFSFERPTLWELYEYQGADAEGPKGYALLRIVAPDTVVAGESHEGSARVSQGGIIEIAAAPNSQFQTVDAYLKPIEQYVTGRKTVQVSGVPAAQYQLSTEVAEEDGLKLNTVLFKDGLQFTISVSSKSFEPSDPVMQEYQKILESFTVGP